MEPEWRAGNHAAALRASRMAHTWGGAAVVTGGGFIVVSFIIIMSLGLGTLSQDSSADSQ